MAFREYENDDDPIAHYDDRYADMRSEFNSSLVIEVAKRQNTIYGQNGEPYPAPIKGPDLVGLESFLKRLLYSDEMPYRLKRVQGVEYGYPLPMAVDIKRLSAYGRIYHPSKAYPPDWELFFDLYQQHPISGYTHVDWGVSEDDFLKRHGVEFGLEKRHVDIAHDFIALYRDRARKSRLKSRMSDWLSGPKRNRAYLAKALTDIFDEYSRVMVVNLVLLYRKAACNGRDDARRRGYELLNRHAEDHQGYLDEIERKNVPEHFVSLEEVKADWARFTNNMRHKPTLFHKEIFIDYFGRIEHSEDAGYHVHVCFVYKGSATQRDFWYSHEIGKYWVNITEGRGYYCSCNALAAQGRYGDQVGIGVIEHDDFRKIRFLWQAVSYFVKASQIVRMKDTKKAQMFLHGKPRKRVGTKLGRPRRPGLHGPEYRERLARIFV